MGAGLGDMYKQTGASERVNKSQVSYVFHTVNIVEPLSSGNCWTDFYPVWFGSFKKGGFVSREFTKAREVPLYKVRSEMEYFIKSCPGRCSLLH